MVGLRAGSLALALFFSVTSQTHATVFAPADLTQLVLAARAIVHGRIVDLRPQLTDDHRRVDTLVTIDVATYLKGDLGSTVTFRVPGGELGRYRTVVLDAPHFGVGEEVVLLLSARGPSIPYVLGLTQGVFRVAPDPVTGERRVTPAPLVREGADWRPVVRGDPARQSPLLTDFARQVQSILGAQR
jgi:hypothetical protein